MIKDRAIEMSSGWTIKDDNSFIGLGITPTKNTDPNKKQADVIFLGVRRPDVGIRFVRFS